MKLATQRIDLRAGDDLPTFAAVLEDNNGDPVDLDGAVAYLRVRHPDGSVTERIAAIADAASGSVTYDWTGAETRAWGVGVHELSVRATYVDKQVTAAADRNCHLVIRPEIPIIADPGTGLYADEQFLDETFSVWGFEDINGFEWEHASDGITYDYNSNKVPQPLAGSFIESADLGSSYSVVEVGDYLYLAVYDTGKVIKYNHTTHTIEAALTVTALSPANMIESEGYLWVACDAGAAVQGDVVRVDLTSFTVAQTVTGCGNGVWGINSDDNGDIWVTNQYNGGNAQVTKISKSDYSKTVVAFGPSDT